MSLDREKRIEQRAYALWEAEGYPHGKHEEHWLRAAHEIDAEQTAPAGKGRTPQRGNGHVSPNSRRPSPQRRKSGEPRMA